MKTKRLLSLLLIFSMLSVSLAACGEDSTSADTVEADMTTAETTETEPETKAIPPLPDITFQGEDFIILVNNRTDDYHSVEFAAEEATGNGINDAVFERNTLVEEEYDINLINQPTNGEANALRQNVLAAVHAYDIALIGLVDAGQLALEKLLIDFNTLPYLCLEENWWDQNASADLSLANQKFMTIGDMNINDKDMTWCMFFDKQLAIDHEVPDLYALASEKKWTYDTLHTLSENVSTDLNGDGIFNEEDRYGHVTVFARSTIAYMYAMDAMSFVKDQDDLPQLSLDNPLLFDAYDTVRNLFFTANISHDVETMPYSGYPHQWRKCEAMFGNMQILFYAEAMQNAERFRDFENDFGILPLPSGTEGSYGKHMVWKEAYITTAPLTLTQSDSLMERAGVLLEAIQRYSHDTILSAYYDKALKGKFSRDESSSAMIDIIFATRYYDIGTYYGWGGINDTWMSAGKSGSESVASMLESKQAKAEQAIADSIADLLG